MRKVDYINCPTCNKDIKPILWKSQPIKVCPDCGNVLEVGVLQADYTLAKERLEAFHTCPHWHHWDDGSYYSHSHKSGDIPHGHHGSRYGLPNKIEAPIVLSDYKIGDV
jgi:Zn-finger nucleic acid-binding protein